MSSNKYTTTKNQLLFLVCGDQDYQEKNTNEGGRKRDTERKKQRDRGRAANKKKKKKTTTGRCWFQTCCWKTEEEGKVGLFESFLAKWWTLFFLSCIITTTTDNHCCQNPILVRQSWSKRKRTIVVLLDILGNYFFFNYCFLSFTFLSTTITKNHHNHHRCRWLWLQEYHFSTT